MFVPLTPLDFKRRAVQLFGRKIGIVDGDRRFTYQEFGERATRLANALRDRGLQSGDRVAYLAFNSYPLLEGYFGVLEASGVLLPLNIRLAVDELAYILDHAGPRFLICDSSLKALVDEIRPLVGSLPELIWIGAVLDGSTDPLYDDVVASGSSEDHRVKVDENAVAELFYTSGTTGRPKGVMLTHRNLYLHALSSLVSKHASDRDVQLHTIPLFHVNGWGTPQALTAVGGTHVMLRKFAADEVLQLIEQERVTRLLLVPTMLNMILNVPDVEAYDLSSLQLINTGGAPTPPDMLRRAESLLQCEVVGGYGLTETSPVLSYAGQKSYLEGQVDTRAQRQASAGLPIVGVEVRLLDSQGQELPWNGYEIGEIVVRGNTVMKGYWNDSDGTDEAIRDGWLYTGDMAVIDPEGYILIVDRKKDLIISGGENISSAEIERILYEHPAVLESAVVGAPDDVWGEVPRALVSLRAGAEATEDEILEFCRRRLAGFKVPKSVSFVRELPKGGTGKILKRELREQFWQDQVLRVH